MLRRWILAIALVACGTDADFADDSGTAADALTSVAFPLRVSANARYLEDQNGVPFPILGDAGWEAPNNLTAAEQQAYIADRAARGFSAVLAESIEHKFSINKPPLNRAGNLPFTQRLSGATYTGSPNGTLSASGTHNQFGADPYSDINTQAPDFTSPNPTYWANLDSYISLCADNGILVLLFPAYVGWGGGDEGWMNEMVVNDALIGAGALAGQPYANATKSKLWNYGAWLANRYKSFGNILWVHGGDYGKNNGFTVAQKNAINSLFAGIKSVSGQASRLHTSHWDRPSLGNDVTFPAGSFDLLAVYNDATVAQRSRTAYATTPVTPTFQIEDLYENNPNGGTPTRRFQWWSFLSTIGGTFFGNEPLWRMDTGWQSLLASTGSRDMERLNGFVRSIAWHQLVPSGLGGMRTLVTSNVGDPNGQDYITAAASPDGALLVAYVPPAGASSFTIDMGALSGTTLARWFDPTTASYSTIGSFANSGNRTFTRPGNNAAGAGDWVLLLTATASQNTPPTLVNAASATPTGSTSATLSVLGADDGGEAALTYTWSSASSVSFSANGTNASKNTSATFPGPGTYNVLVTLQDTQGLTTTSSIEVTLTADTTTVRLNFQPAASPVPAGYLVDAGLVYGNRGNGYSYGWNTDNTAQARDRNATSDQRYDTFNHLQAPPNPNALWEIGLANGTYIVRLVGGDPSHFDSVYALRAESVLIASGTPTSSERFVDGTAAITVSDGRLTISSAPGAVNNKIAFIEITPQSVTNQAPTLATPASASSNGASVSLSVLGADDGGEAGLTYTWTASGPAAVSFTSNGSNAAKTTSATLSQVGTYSFTVQLSDGNGGTATSNASVTVSAALSSVSVTPTSATVATGATRQFSATGRDQFGAVLASQPTFAWSVTGGGTVSSTGLFTAGGSAGGPFTLSATSGANSASASVTVTGGSTTITLGETNVPASSDGNNANYIVAQQATLASSGTITSLSLYVDSVGGSVRLGVYDATGPGGGPGALVAQTPSFTPATTGWNTQSVTAPAALPAGNYWLVHLPSSNGLRTRISGGGSAGWRSFTYGAMPASFGTVEGGDSVHWSIYATLTSP